MMTMRSGFQSPSIGVGPNPLHDVFSRMSGDECRDFRDVFSKTGRVIHRQSSTRYAFMACPVVWCSDRGFHPAGASLSSRRRLMCSRRKSKRPKIS